MTSNNRNNDPKLPLDKVVMLLLLAGLLFASPFFDWLLRDRPVWYTPFVLWILLIFAIYLANRDQDKS